MKDRLYVGTHNSEVISINLKTMKKEWTYKDPVRTFPYHSSAAVTEKLVVVGGQDKQVHCINRKTGTLVWKYRTRGEVNSSPVIAGKRVFVGSNDGFLYAFQLTDGTLIKKYSIGRPVTASPAIGNGHLLIGSESSKGKLICFGKKK